MAWVELRLRNGCVLEALPPVCLFCGARVAQAYGLWLMVGDRQLSFRLPVCRADQGRANFRDLQTALGDALLKAAPGAGAAGLGLVFPGLVLKESRPSATTIPVGGVSPVFVAALRTIREREAEAFEQGLRAGPPEETRPAPEPSGPNPFAGLVAGEPVVPLACISCPHCRVQLRLPDHLAGAPVRCSGCAAVFVVPVAAASPSAPARRSPTRWRRRVATVLGGVLLLAVAVAAGWWFGTGAPVRWLSSAEGTPRHAGLWQDDGPVRPPFAVDAKLLEPGQTAYLSDLQEFDVRAGLWPFAKNGLQGDPNRLPIVVNGVPSPRGLSMYPSQEVGVRARYALGRRALFFQSSVALNDDSIGSSAVTFEVVGDGKALWRSRPIGRRGDVDGCDLAVSTIDVLELRTHLSGDGEGAHGVWVEPRLFKGR